jgi:dihydrofolate reductase
MRKLSVFNHVTLDGYFVGVNGDFSWAHAGNDDPEFQTWVAENASGDSELLFGRVTYGMMAGYWPTANAERYDPVVAKRMNSLPKVVFSKTLDNAAWNNTRLLKGDLVAEVKKLKNESGPVMVLMGSGTIVTQLAAAGLVDEYQVVIDPVVLGKGRTMFEGLEKMISLKITNSRTFKNGKIFVCFEPA